MCGQPTAYNTYATLPYTNPLFMGFSCSQNVNKEIIIWNTKRHTKPQKPRVSGVFLYPLISLRRPEMWWGFLCNIFVH